MTNDFDCIIGVDPGAMGGIAIHLVDPEFGYVNTMKMPKDMAGLHDFFAYYGKTYKTIVFVEKLNVRRDDVFVRGDRAAMGKLYRIQKLMANYEYLKALIETAGIPYVLVHPGKWTAYLGLRLVQKNGPKETKQERKNRYKEFAQRNYPDIKVTLWNADALNILHFGRKLLVDDPNWVKSNIPKREYEKLF